MKQTIDLLQRFVCRIRSLRKSQDAGFKLPFQPYGAGDTERCIEIPWAISCYRGEYRVLDVGYANAEDRYINPLMALKIPELYGLDLVSRAIQRLSPVVGDIRNAPFRDGIFDLVLCISTIEHVGWNNTIYFKGKLPQDPEGDLQAIKEMARMTRKGGRIVITVPYGKLQDYGWFQQYDKKRLDKLISMAGCRLLKKDLYAYKNNGWHHASEKDLEYILYKDNQAPAAAGLACVILAR